MQILKNIILVIDGWTLLVASMFVIILYNKWLSNPKFVYTNVHKGQSKTIEHAQNMKILWLKDVLSFLEQFILKFKSYWKVHWLAKILS